jgi:hypothetical protein
MPLNGEELGGELASRQDDGSWKHIFEPDPSRQKSSCFSAYCFVSVCLVASGIFVMFTYTLLLVSGFTAVSGGLLDRQAASSPSMPQYFQTTPEVYAGEYMVDVKVSESKLMVMKVQHRLESLPS